MLLEVNMRDRLSWTVSKKLNNFNATEGVLYSAPSFIAERSVLC